MDLQKLDNIKVGDEFDHWKIEEFLGKGGNSSVWKAVNSNQTKSVAIKFLSSRHFRNETRYNRFIDECTALAACSEIPGVMPLIESKTPKLASKDNRPWLIFPLGTPMSDYDFSNVTLTEVVRLGCSLAKTLQMIHANGYSHRDIKPENIFKINDQWVLGDFGLADFNDKLAESHEGEIVGPRFYIAPEMLDTGEKDGEKADVYSFGKLLWKLASGKKFPIPHQINSDDLELSLVKLLGNGDAASIDKLLESCTNLNPKNRPEMQRVHLELESWLGLQMESSDNEIKGWLKQKFLSLGAAQKINRKEVTDISEKYNANRISIFQDIKETMLQIQSSFEDIGLSKIWNNGGNKQGVESNVYPAWVITGDRNPPLNDMFVFSHSVMGQLNLESSNLFIVATFALGQPILPNSERKPLKTIYDLEKGVLVSACLYSVVRDMKPYRVGPEVPKEVVSHWEDRGSFQIGFPSESKLINSLKVGLLNNLELTLRAAVERVD